MRPLTTSLLLVALATGLSAKSSGSKQYRVQQLDVDAYVQPDGQLRVLERITYQFKGGFTFAYRDIPHRHQTTISDVVVSDGERQYNPADTKAPGTFQVVDRSRTTRVTWYYRGDVPTRTFSVEYRVTGEVHRYADVAELYYQFVGDDWDHSIGSVHVNVHLPEGNYTSDDVRAWAHGPLRGTVKKIEPDLITLDVSPLPAHTFWEGRILFPPRLLTGLVEADSP
jgi:uncharacterized membrane protein